jgi:hypothetical protein
MFQEQFTEALNNKNALRDAMKTLLEHGMRKTELSELLSVMSANMEVVKLNFKELRSSGVRELPETEFTFGGLLNLWVVVETDNLKDYGITLSPESRAVCHAVLTTQLELDRLPPWIQGSIAAVCASQQIFLTDEQEKAALDAILKNVMDTVLFEFKSEAKDAQPVHDERDLRQLIAAVTWEYAEEMLGQKKDIKGDN